MSSIRFLPNCVSTSVPASKEKNSENIPPIEQAGSFPLA